MADVQFVRTILTATKGTIAPIPMERRNHCIGLVCHIRTLLVPIAVLNK